MRFAIRNFQSLERKNSAPGVEFYDQAYFYSNTGLCPVSRWISGFNTRICGMSAGSRKEGSPCSHPGSHCLCDCVPKLSTHSFIRLTNLLSLHPLGQWSANYGS